jgi:choice-of-anchor A domain-containing protein
MIKGRLSRLIFGLALCLSGLPAFALDFNFGVAGEYSAFFFGSASNLSDVQGRLAVGGNLATIYGRSVGAMLPAGSTGPSLVVGGDINTFSGTISRGQGVVGYGVYRGIRANQVPANLDLRKEDLPFEFAAERAYLSLLSDELAALEPTGVVTQKFMSVTLTGSNRSLEVFRLEADQVKSALNFDLKNVASSAIIVFNIYADRERSIRFGISMSVLNSRKSQVILNFPDTRTLNFTSAQVVGTVLAPHACVRNSAGHIDGAIIADSWESNMSIGYSPFIPQGLQ